ncbi:ATG8-interacting protein 2 [Mercurialis annua]|uniref:ATG8-interacting protein 2 n=1 Tax=Mercurialis annua TaxID=3986 RepID=UPI00215FA3EE|nr:ATG8-interacting protein 2 [Mercurialis annua]XP_050237515.1 ATG8-interacting protein 2 [Mercurialis annua]XP_050237516.1 ATG8-interacting protein 2 [Mercurialis annua]
MADKGEGEVDNTTREEGGEDNTTRQEGGEDNTTREEGGEDNTIHEEGEENNSRGNEWEVVSLTASTYAAAPGPKEVELQDENRGSAYGEGEAESSRPLLVHGHFNFPSSFIFPPNQHENLPLETDNSKALDEQVGKNAVAELGLEESDKSGRKDEENWPLKGLDESEEIPGLQFPDGKAISGSKFEESTTLQDLVLNEKGQSMYSADPFDSLHSETALGGSDTYGDNLGIPDVIEPSEQGSEFSTEISQTPKAADNDESDLPCEAWWKRRAASLYSHAKETNTFWSIFVAAAVMGIVIIGHHWQQERWRALQLKWQTNINEKTGRVLGPISRLKGVIVGGHRRGSFIRGSSSSET